MLAAAGRAAADVWRAASLAATTGSFQVALRCFSAAASPLAASIAAAAAAPDFARGFSCSPSCSEVASMTSAAQEEPGIVPGVAQGKILSLNSGKDHSACRQAPMICCVMSLILSGAPERALLGPLKAEDFQYLGTQWMTEHLGDHEQRLPALRGDLAAHLPLQGWGLGQSQALQQHLHTAPGHAAG